MAKEYLSDEARERQEMLTGIIYHSMFMRKLPFFWVFFKKLGFSALLLFLYLVYVKDVEIIKAMGVFLLSIIVIVKFFMHEKFERKYTVSFFNAKGIIIEKKRALDRERGIAKGDSW